MIGTRTNPDASFRGAGEAREPGFGSFQTEYATVTDPNCPPASDSAPAIVASVCAMRSYHRPAVHAPARPIASAADRANGRGTEGGHPCRQDVCSLSPSRRLP